MDMKKLMQQAQKMQKEMEQKVGEIETQTFNFESNGVKVKLSGALEVKEIVIDESLMGDKESLQDVLMIVVNQAITTVEKKKASVYETAQKAMKSPF